MSDSFSVCMVFWQEGCLALKKIREQVFIIEQGVPEELEWDGLDAGALHVLAVDQLGAPIGCGRMLPNGHIGRVAVVPLWRHQKVGSRMMNVLLDYARTHELASVDIHAQVQARLFYDQFAFVETGDEFMDAGIPHIKMSLVF